MLRRALSSLAVALLLAGCDDTNIVGTGGGTAGDIVFSSDRGGATFEVFAIAPDGGRLRQLTTDVNTNDLAPAMSPDGSLIAWEREIVEQGRVRADVWVMNADGSSPRALVTNASDNRAPGWTPDGAAVVYASFVTGNWEIFRIDAGGGTPVNLTNSPFADQHPRVAPDGRIVFHTNRDLDFEIYAMRADGSDPVNLTSQPGDDRFPAWSPDGSRIVWTRFEGSFDLWIMDADGGNPRTLVATDFREEHPSVSPDGRSVVFQSDRFPPLSLHIVSIATGATRVLTGDEPGESGSNQEPWWGVRTR